MLTYIILFVSEQIQSQQAIKKLFPTLYPDIWKRNVHKTMK